MKEKKIFDAITNVPDELVDEARQVKLKSSFQPWKKRTALIACVTLVIVIIIVSIVPHTRYSSEEALANVVFPKAYAFDDIDTKRAVIDSNPVDDDFLNALNEFSYNTAPQIFVDSSGNKNYSPVSLYYALAMVATGAEGETANELLSLLGVSDQTTLSMQSGNLYRQLYTDNKVGKLKIANSLWMNNDIDWKKDFVENAAEHFYASSFSMDFSDKKTRQSMAKWISDHTNSTLKPEIEISPDQIFTILNTVYFYDEWIDRFNKSKTAEDNFYLSNGTTVNSSFMNKSYTSAGFTKDRSFTRSSLNFKNGSRMVFILPDEGISPQEFLSTPEKIKAAFEGEDENYGEVVWQIPKFSFSAKLDLVDTLKNLGVSSAFEGNANFSGITNQMAFISHIRQETYIGIDENGVEASAFTEIGLAGAGQPEEQKDRADMILNRPFIYGITAPNGTLLFIGICENPIAE